MKNGKRILCMLLAVILFALCLCSCSQNTQKASESVTLNVSLYGFIPDYSSFEETVKTFWEEKHPDVKLNFVEWDGYSEEGLDDLDVFVFDTLNLDTFAAKGYLLPLTKADIQAYDDLLAPAMEGCLVDGEIVAVPQFLCSALLFTRKDDAELDGVKNLDQLHDVLDGKELLTDDSEDGNTVCRYLQALNDENQRYMDTYPPLEKDSLQEGAVDALENIRDMRLVESEKQPVDNESYYYAQRFSQGLGRAYIGYSESLSLMEDPSGVNFSMFSMTEKENIPVFYADTAAVNAKISDEKKQAAIEFLNMITGSDLLYRSASRRRDQAAEPEGHRREAGKGDRRAARQQKEIRQDHFPDPVHLFCAGNYLFPGDDDHRFGDRGSDAPPVQRSVRNMVLQALPKE